MSVSTTILAPGEGDTGTVAAVSRWTKFLRWRKGFDERMERLAGDEEREIEWPGPREDPNEEPSEPWAREGQPRERPFAAWKDES